MNDAQLIIFTALLSALTSSGVMSLIIYLIQRRDKRKEKEELNNSAQSKMLLGLGHDRITRLTDKYIRRGAITIREKTNLKFLYIPYHELGGNGDCELAYDEVITLPVVSDEEADRMDTEHRRKEYTD